MTRQDIQKTLADIRACAGDDEAAHSMQDRFTEQVLRAIAAGAPMAQELAADAVAVYDIEFARWCA